MDEPKEIWVFDYYSPKVIGPCKVVEVSDGHNCLRYKHNDSARGVCIIPRDKSSCTKKQAVEACYKHHERKIKREQEELNERIRLLKKFYSEELYG